ncbi:hypothetical protein BCR32DRAFT_285555 [Anaeromyces robustus]|uniref:Uncharacterized protein n=1 Tax=Anaeromyces robustus TaxID=1754192 RepID=A0A1Y1WJY7_9FUNG|nr:hypothetical protein BCR32DRAFT_285555 [Anaeromyces robustus]|eukprot:ORX73526.1 hypothetical protein BCR32DRAFT_285555 [Anaeromyces robustus]
MIKDTRRRKVNNSESSEQNINDTSIIEIKDAEKQKPIRKRNMTNIQMLNENEKFSITEEANNLFLKISMSQLLSASPSFRKKFEQGCKPRVEKILCSLTNTNIPVVCGEIDNKTFKILYDTGLNYSEDIAAADGTVKDLTK